VRKGLLAVLLTLATLAAAGSTPVMAHSVALTVPTQQISVSGNGVAMYPAFAMGTSRYAVTTTAATLGTVTVDASTSDPAGSVWIDGQPAASGSTTLTGLSSGDEISVLIDDSAGTAAYSLIYLPVGFPTMTVVTDKPGIAPGDVFLTPSDFANTNFETVVDDNGVPVYVRTDTGVPTDFMQQPNGDYSVFRATATGGGEIVELNAAFQQIAAYRTAGLPNTGGRDAILLANGDRWLLSNVPDTAGNIDAVIQEQDADGNVLFQWSSASDPALLANSMVSMPDYIHLNSIALMPNGDILASFRHLSQVVEIATSAHDGFAPGDIVWSLGGRDPSLTITNDLGPCAQHDATVLSNGDILMFDDGSESIGGSPLFCVNPADPTGPAIARPQSRVAEYSIDAADNSATLVWSYAVPGRATNFEGSAQRLANGNTLVGWGNLTAALATEVDGSGQALWEIKDSTGLFSYRAERFVVPDVIAPAVNVTEPADGDTYAFGETVDSDFSCTDTGGSNLQSCSGPVVEGGAIDTSTPGVHTFTVVATDGAGNTTSVTRTYHVGPAPVPYRPDALIKRPSAAAYVGGNIYGGIANQHITESIAHTGKAALARARFQNDGSNTDQITITGTAGTARFRVSYFAGTTNVTARVIAGTYRTPNLAHGQSFTLRIKVTRTAAANVGDARTVKLTGRSVHDPALHDAVATIVRAVR
jgi:hypothetical protein